MGNERKYRESVSTIAYLGLKLNPTMKAGSDIAGYGYFLMNGFMGERVFPP